MSATAVAIAWLGEQLDGVKVIRWTDPVATKPHVLVAEVPGGAAVTNPPRLDEAHVQLDSVAATAVGVEQLTAAVRAAMHQLPGQIVAGYVVTAVDDVGLPFPFPSVDPTAHRVTCTVALYMHPEV